MNFVSPIYAWGPITHISLVKEAGWKNGDVVSGAHSADMISLNYITSVGSSKTKYVYAHNLMNRDGKILPVSDDDNGNEIPGFGLKMMRAYYITEQVHPERFDLNDRYYALGWVFHQLSDKYAHGRNGYANKKCSLKDIPWDLKKIGNHGLAELIVDGIMMKNYQITSHNCYSTNHHQLIHEGSIIFYNEAKESPRQRTISRGNIIPCFDAEAMQRSWQSWVLANFSLVKLMTEQSWFGEAEREYQDCWKYFNRSLQAIDNFYINADAYPSDIFSLATNDEPIESKINFFQFFVLAKAYAQEEAEEIPEYLYYRFIQEVSEEVKRMGGNFDNEEIFKKAVEKVIEKDLADNNPESIRMWARMMKEMLLKDNKHFKEIMKKTEDLIAPLIDGNKPVRGETVEEKFPLISARIDDGNNGTGVDVSSIIMRINGEKVISEWDEAKDCVKYKPKKSLPQGKVYVSLYASDRAGNKSSLSWFFYIGKKSLLEKLRDYLSSWPFLFVISSLILFISLIFLKRIYRIKTIDQRP